MLGGFTAAFMATLTDYAGHNWFDLYRFHDVVIPWGGCSFFYIFRIMFTMGTLFSQFYPQKKCMGQSICEYTCPFHAWLGNGNLSVKHKKGRDFERCWLIQKQ